MKKNLYLMLAIFVLLNTNAQVGYHIQNPIGNGSDMYALNNDSLYMSVGVTNNAHMMYINPATKEWKYLNSNPLPNYGTPIIRDKNNGILRIPGSNSIQATSDGWQTITTSTASLPYVNKCPSNYYGYFNVGSSYTLCYSTNGLNWTNATMPAPTTILAARNFGNKIVVLPATVSSSVYISNNGGQSYTGIANTTTFTGTFLDFYMASADTFIVITSNSLCKSYNAGVTWTNTPLTGSPFTKAAFKNKNEFAIQPQNAPPTFSYTTNGGLTWAVNTTTLPVAGVGSLFYSNNYYYLYPWFRTNDYGATWDHFLPNMKNVAFSVDFNGNKGLLGLKSGGYSYSLDKGRSFNHYLNTISSNQDMMAVKVLNNGDFIGGDRKGQVYVSNNNGQTWIQKNTETLNPNSIRFLASANQNTIMLTRAGLPVVSVDGAASFSVVVYSINGGNHIQAMKPNGQLLDLRELTNGWETRTFDITGATTVISTYTTTNSETLGAFYMVNNTDGYLLTRDNNLKINNIYKTTDGGLTFTQKTAISQYTTGSSAYINTPFVSGIPLFHNFGNDTVIVTANYNNYYHVSYNGGVSWNTVTPAFVPGNTTYGNTIYRMHFFTYNSYIAITGDAFGPKGLFLNTLGVGVGATGITELDFDNKRNDLVLFPNPSQNQQTISFLNLDNEVQITIINLSGQIVKSTTTTENHFSIDGLNSGMYIVRVVGKEKTVRTAKLLIQ